MAYNKEYSKKYYQEHREHYLKYQREHNKEYNRIRTEKRRLKWLLNKAGYNSLEEMEQDKKKEEKNKYSFIKSKYTLELSYCGTTIYMVNFKPFGITIDEWLDSLETGKELEIKENLSNTFYS